MDGEMDTIETLYRGDFGAVELTWCDGRRAAAERPSFAPLLRMVLPLQGAFLWHVGAEEVFADATKILFAGLGDTRAISHPAGGDRSLVVTPNPQVVEELTGRGADRPGQWLKTRWRRHSYRTQLAARILYAQCRHDAGPLAIEEALVCLLTLAIDEPFGIAPRARRGADRTLLRAKTFLHTQASPRTRLAEVADAAGVSPTYLTRLFTAAEGMPLHQYALKLKLSAALDALPANTDITSLAMDLGFSSHSHLTSAFQSRFGAPPSAVRSLLRARAPIVAGQARQGRVRRPLWAADGEPYAT